MKHKYTGILAALIICVSVPASAQLFKPFTSFRVIKTERFDIIFPEESEPSARLLASYADRVYEYVSSLLGIEYPGRIPVTFAPHTDMFNAYYKSLPGSYIVIYDTVMDLEWTNFANSLESLFLHELTHAVSLNSRNAVSRVLHRIFGNWIISPTLIYAPLFMIEGVTVSFESLSGFGRANDPLTRQKLRQAIHEGKFLTPFQASGVYDLPDQNGIYYEYGGLFSAWLQQTYGMEKYAELWQAMGKDIKTSFFSSFFVYRSAFYLTFKRIYDVDFLDAWNAFSDFLALNNIEENHDELFPAQYRFFSEKRNSISALAAWGNSVYVLDSQESKIHVYDTVTEKLRSINVDILTSYDIDVSPDGSALLVSGYNVTGSRYRAVVIEYRTDGRKTGRSFHGLYKARYFRDGVIGIRSELHNTCIVYEDFNGGSEVLFRGSEELLFSGPQALDNERIVFIAARSGVRELLLYNYVSGELFRIEDTGGGDYWRYMRGLNVSEGRIFFSHNADDRMYKLASIDLESMQAVFSERDFSGGVFYPVSANGEIYYRGAFFSGDGFLRFPETAGSISGTQDEIMLVKADNEDYGMAAAPKTEKTAYSGPSKMYIGLKYMNPFKFWLPMLLIRDRGDGENFKISLDGGGIYSVISDPTDRNTVLFIVLADIAYRMAAIDEFSWTSTVPGFPVTLGFFDGVMTDSGSNPYRYTTASLSGSFTLYPGAMGMGFSLGGQYVRVADDDGGASAYQWKETGHAFALTAGLAFSNVSKRQHELFGTGLSLNITGISVLENFSPRVESMFKASAETRFPLNLTLYGAYDEMGMNLQGVSRIYGDPMFAEAASAEYSHPGGLDLTWLAGGEASVGLFSFEFQRNFSHFYFNRLFGTLTLRNVLYDSKGHPRAEGIAVNDMRLAQSLVLKLSLVSSIFPLNFLRSFLNRISGLHGNFPTQLPEAAFPSALAQVLV